MAVRRGSNGRVNPLHPTLEWLALTAAALAFSCTAPVTPTTTPNEVIVVGTEETQDSEELRQQTPTVHSKPCTEDNPSGCTSGPTRSKLDSNKRYPITVNPDDPSLGPGDAPVTLVVFSDFECPFCGQLETVLRQLRSRFGHEVRVVWKDLPLPRHSFALSAAVLAREAYAKFGVERFWFVHDELFIHQTQLSDAWLAEFAKTSELTWPPDARYVPRINQDVQLADQLGINATPTVFVNGRPVVGVQAEGVYADLVRDELDHAQRR